MNKKWKDMTLAEKEEWMKNRPKTMKGVKWLVYAAIAVVAMVIIGIATSDSPVEKTINPIVYDSLKYEQKDSILRVWSMPYRFDATRLVKREVLDQDADIDMPGQIVVVDVDEHWCRFGGTGTAKNGFGVKLKFRYAVDYYVFKDSIVWRKVDIMQ